MTSTEQLVATIEAVMELHNQQEDFTTVAHRTGALVGYGLASAALHTAAAALHLYRGGFFAESMPQARLAFELGVTAQWVHLKRDSGSVEALGELGLRSIRLFAQEARGAEWLTPEQADALLRKEEDEDHRLSPMASELKSFEAVCRAFTDGPALYANYRALSRECHAGGGLLTRFVGDNGTGELVSRDPVADSWHEAAASVAIGVILAWAAFNEWWEGHPHKATLDDLAGRIGAPTALYLR